MGDSRDGPRSRRGLPSAGAWAAMLTLWLPPAEAGAPEVGPGVRGPGGASLPGPVVAGTVVAGTAMAGAAMAESVLAGVEPVGATGAEGSLVERSMTGRGWNEGRT